MCFVFLEPIGRIWNEKKYGQILYLWFEITHLTLINIMFPHLTVWKRTTTPIKLRNIQSEGFTLCYQAEFRNVNIHF